MGILFDTSTLVAAIIDSHPAHHRALPWLQRVKAGEIELVVASHSLAELYSVLSTLPVRPRIGPGLAWRLIQVNIVSNAQAVTLTSAEYNATIKAMSELGLSGGIVYDALIATAASKAKVERLLTLNLNHFRRVWNGPQHVLATP